jgi:hypothetical protein
MNDTIGRARRALPGLRLAVLLVAAAWLGGCSTCFGKPHGGGCLIPSGERILWAAKRAALDPYTWAPAAGALAFGIAEDWDHEVSDWARREQPIFGGSAGQAGRASRNATIGLSLATAMATPSGCNWGLNKAKVVAVQTYSALAPQIITRELKKATDRVRPNGRDDLSFPSSIAAEAAGWAASGRRNVRAMSIPRGYRTALEGCFTTLTALTAWSRVENGAHYPSDCLAGVAIGNFTSLFLQDAILGPSWRDFRLGVAPGREQTQFGLTYSFCK